MGQTGTGTGHLQGIYGNGEEQTKNAYGTCKGNIMIRA